MSKRLQNIFQRAKQDPEHTKKARLAEVSADLRVLIAHAGLCYKDIAKKIGISAAALSQKLSGESNLTLDSIAAITEAVGYEFDVVFRAKGSHRAKQMWEVHREAMSIIGDAKSLLNEVKVLHAEQQAMSKTIAAMTRARFRGAGTNAANYKFTNICANHENVPVAANG